MKKLLAAGVVLAGVMGGCAAHADVITQTDGYQGGCEAWTGNGSYCIMSQNDPGAAYACAHIYTMHSAKANALIYNANQTGWGFGAYGGLECTNTYWQGQ